ncbi:MAG: molybdopterin biosynthesis protein MoeA, partial [Gemmatimonadota bacterium]
MSTPRGLAFEQARRAILSTAADVERRVSVRPIESALEHALAEPIQSSIALPPWNNAGMDGYAVRRADVIGATAQAPVVLPVIATSMAGADVTTLPVVRPGTAVRIMTGAPMPPEADAVIRIEDTDGGGANGGGANGGGANGGSANGGSAQVTITDARDATGRGNVRPRGEDVAEGAQLFAAGTTIRAAHLGVLASIGCATVRVFERPRVTILSSGDELVLLDRFHEVAAGKRIIASSSYALPPLLRSAGADVTVAPIAEDSLAGMTAAVAAALERGCDLLVTTGGISVGAHDFTRDAIDANGGSAQVTITDARDAIGRGNVRPRGEDVAEGAQLFAAGTTIRAAHLGVLASIG